MMARPANTMNLYTQPQLQAPSERFILPVCLDRQGLGALLSLLHFGAFEAGYLDNEQLFYDVLEALAFINAPERTACTPDAPPPTKPDKDAIKAAMRSYGGMTSLSQEEPETMACNQIIKIGANWYLYSDCAGCDQPLYFLLTPTGLDANAQPIPQSDTTKQLGTEGSAPLITTQVPCFAKGATAYLLSRAASFWNSVTDAATVGIDTALGSYDEIAQYAAIAAELVTGNSDLREIAAIGKDAIENAITSTQTQSALETAWTFTEAPNRAQLETWTRSAPFAVGVVPVRSALSLWLRFSVIFNYSNRLQSIIEQCRADDPTAFPTSFLTADNAHRVTTFTMTAANFNRYCGVFNNVVALGSSIENTTGGGSLHRIRANALATIEPTYFYDREVTDLINLDGAGAFNPAGITLAQIQAAIPAVAFWANTGISSVDGDLYVHDSQHQYEFSAVKFYVVQTI